MSNRDNCGICGETYLDENLMECITCGREFCYRCGNWRTRLCARCDKKASDALPSKEENQN